MKILCRVYSLLLVVFIGCCPYRLARENLVIQHSPKPIIDSSTQFLFVPSTPECDSLIDDALQNFTKRINEERNWERGRWQLELSLIKDSLSIANRLIYNLKKKLTVIPARDSILVTVEKFVGHTDEELTASKWKGFKWGIIVAIGGGFILFILLKLLRSKLLC